MRPVRHHSILIPDEVGLDYMTRQIKPWFAHRNENAAYLNPPVFKCVIIIINFRGGVGEGGGWWVT